MTEAVIADIHCQKNGSLYRAVSDFDGQPVWFETEDIEFDPSAEAFGTLWLIPCILSKRNLRIEKPVCKTWYENAHQLMNILCDRWGTEKIKITAETRPTQIAAQEAAAVCFSGGVDSFYTLMKSGSPKYLLCAEPFDLPSSFTETFKVGRQRLERVAEAVGSIPITIRSNIHEHPSFKIHKFLDTHFAILACMGHLLAPHIGSVLVSSSHHKDDPDVDAVHWLLDPLHSSKLMQVCHTHADTTRRSKVAELADWPLARENLFVCFNKQGANRNCSRCEKCVRTMLDLHILGKLESFQIFDLSRPLWEAMDQVKLLTYPETYQSALSEPLDPRLASGIWRMLRRERERIWGLEDAALYRRHVDEEFNNMKEGLENALHHYSLLQENYNNLLKDYQESTENRPLKRGVRAVRHVIRMLRSGRRSRANKTNN